MNTHDHSAKKSVDTSLTNTPQEEQVPDNSSGLESFLAMQDAIKKPSKAMLTPQAVLQLQRSIGNQATIRLLSPTAQHHESVQRQDIQEDAGALHSLYKRKYKKLGHRSIILTSEQGVPNDPQETRDIVKANRLQKKGIITNPQGLPPGNYVLVKFADIIVSQDEEDTITLNPVYGLANPSAIEALGNYKEIADIGADENNPKQGKILPEEDNDPPISQTDVYQSAISDCYLHAALIAVVAAQPNLITNLFDVGADNVEVNFPSYQEFGQTHAPLNVTLSKSLFLTDDGEPLYGGKKDSYLWPAFIQKAWAIYKGSYSELAFDRPMEIMSRLTGRETHGEAITGGAINEKVAEAWGIYGRIVAALIANRPITIVTKKWTDRKRPWGRRRNVMPNKRDHGGIGIVHTYAVLNISDRDLQRDNEWPDATLTLRDPRNKEGETFDLELKKLIDTRKFAYVATGE